MKRHKKQILEPDQGQVDAQGADPGAGAEGPLADSEESPPPPAGGADGPLSEGLELVEPPDQAIERLEEEVGTLKDQLLRTAAEFDNFRKRTARERQDMRARAQADLALNVLEALDDLNRVVSMDLTEASTQDVVDGVEMVERKLLQHLEATGLQRVGAEGERFDPNDHEALGMVAAPSPDADGTVATVVQVGYRFGNTLLRPAKVLVHMTTADEEGDS